MSVALARRFRMDVSADNTTWLNFAGMTDFNNTESSTDQSTADYDNNGYDSFEKTLTTWGVTAKANRITTAGAFDPGQELVRKARFQFGDAARVYVRWYDRNGAPEGYSGRALVDWQQTKTGVADVEEVTVAFKGDGILTPQTVSPALAPALPAVASATPTAQTVGKQVQITGNGFTSTVATTGVKFGTVNATSWLVVSDSLIVAVVPTGPAGPANITVTNTAGTSLAFPYTRGA